MARPTLKRIDVVAAIFIAGAVLGACAAQMKNDGNDSFALIAKCQGLDRSARAKS
jgi:hypothetical protein